MPYNLSVKSFRWNVTITNSNLCFYFQPGKTLLTKNIYLPKVFSSMLLYCSVKCTHDLSALKEASFFYGYVVSKKKTSKWAHFIVELTPVIKLRFREITYQFFWSWPYYFHDTIFLRFKIFKWVFKFTVSAIVFPLLFNFLLVILPLFLFLLLTMVSIACNWLKKHKLALYQTQSGRPH